MQNSGLISDTACLEVFSARQHA